MQIGEIYHNSTMDRPQNWRICRQLDATEIYKDLIKRLTMYVYPEELFLNEELKTILGQIVLWYANDNRFKGEMRKGLILRGNCGTGKTMILETLLDIIEFGDNRIAILIHVRDLQAIYLENDLDQIKILKNRFLLLIDDLGVENPDIKNYGNVLEPFNDLFDYRYRNNLETIISTNETPAKLKLYYGDRTIDRFKEVFNEYVFNFKSLRK